MKILVYGINYAPDFIGIAKYTTEMCQYFAQHDHQVTVTTAPPYYPEWRVRRPYRGYFYSQEIINNVQVTRCPLYVPRSPTAFNRIVHHLSFALTSFPAVLFLAFRFRPDVIFVIAPSLLALPNAVLAARLSGATSWLHVQDFEIDAAFDLGFMRGSLLKRIALWLESLVIRQFDRVSSISAAMTKKLEFKGVPPARIVEFRNWVDTLAIVPIAGNTALRTRLNLPTAATVAMYSGNMGAKQGLEYLVDAARQLAERRPDIVFLLCGSGPMKDPLVRMTADFNNVRHLDLQPVDSLSELLATADIHLLPQRPEAQETMLPSKLAGMLASGRPVVAMAHEHSQLFAELDGFGTIVPPGDVNALCSALVKLADDRARRSELGLRSRNLAELRWDHNVILASIDGILENDRKRPRPVRRQRRVRDEIAKFFNFQRWLPRTTLARSASSDVWPANS